MTAYIASLSFVALAEMGDKTQLLAMAFASRYRWQTAMWGVFATSGMLVADAIGIIVGIVLGKSIPERAVKWFAAIIFIAFGVIGLYGSTPRHIWSPTVIAGGAALLLILIYGVVRLGKAGEGR